MIRNKQNNEVIPPNSAHQAVAKPLLHALFSGDWKEEGPSSAFRTAWAGIQMTWTRCKKVKDRNKNAKSTASRFRGGRDHHLLGASGKPSWPR